VLKTAVRDCIAQPAGVESLSNIPLANMKIKLLVLSGYAKHIFGIHRKKMPKFCTGEMK